MKLKDYLFKKNISICEFANKLMCHRTHISGIIWGRVKPSKRLRLAIEKETDGMVTGEEILCEYSFSEWQNKKNSLRI